MGMLQNLLQKLGLAKSSEVPANEADVAVAETETVTETMEPVETPAMEPAVAELEAPTMETAEEETMAPETVVEPAVEEMGTPAEEAVE